MAVGEAHLRVRERAHGAAPVNPARLDEHVLDLAAVRAGVHSQAPADRARDAAQERKPIDPRRRRGFRDERVRRRRARRDPAILHRLDGVERPAAEPNHDAPDASVAHDEVRAEADDGHGEPGRQTAEQAGEIVLVGRRGEELGRAADPEPRPPAIGALAASRPRKSGASARTSAAMSGKLMAPGRAPRVRRAAHRPIASRCQRRGIRRCRRAKRVCAPSARVSPATAAAARGGGRAPRWRPRDAPCRPPRSAPRPRNRRRRR